jgi:pyruvate,orthophosphate dikinase
MVDLIHFNQNEYLEGEELKERFGLRGKNMFELAALHTPIAPGFLIDSPTLLNGGLKSLSKDELRAGVGKIEKLTSKTFNRPDRPMLFKVVLSPSIQIGSIRSVHTVGINDEVTEGFAKYCGEPFAYHEYRHYLEQVSKRFLGKKDKDFKAITEAYPNASDKELCKMFREAVVPDFPQDGYDQLHLVLTKLAEQYLGDEMNEGIEAGMLVQMMVYGNFGEDSYNGSFYSRNIVTGEAQLSGHFGHNEFDTLPEDGKDINTIKSEYLKELKQIATLLEEQYLDIRQIKFTIEEGRVWIVEQNPVDAKSTQAEIRTLLDLNRKGLIASEKMILSIPPTQLQDLLHPVIDHKTTAAMPKVQGGIAGSPGAAIGRICFSTERLMAEYRRCNLAGLNSDLILCMKATYAEDVQAIEVGKGVISSEGGYASHAPVVSRSLRKPCIVNNDVEYHDGYIMIDGVRINELDTISMEVPTYADPTIWVGQAKMVYPDTSTNGLEEFIGKVREHVKHFQVMAIAENMNDIAIAMRLGAAGIGSFSMDALLRQPDASAVFREAILLSEPEPRKKALAELERVLSKSVREVFDSVGGQRVMLQLLDKPLTEFLPHDPEQAKAFYESLQRKHPHLTSAELGNRANQLRNINPMMGLRGSRIAISYPDLYEAQFAAVLRAAYSFLQERGKAPEFDMMVPGVMGDTEMKFIRNGRNIEGTIIRGLNGVQNDLMKEWGLERLPFHYRIGVLIELPAAALMAGHMAKQSDFFVVGTQILTQTTAGMSYDDINSFLPSFTQYDILRDNPFQILTNPVKQLIALAREFGVITRPDLKVGLCGGHASDPANIEFAINSKLDFASCNPYGVPIAMLAVAQHAIKRAGV